MNIKFIKDYGEVKKGEIRMTDNDEDGQALIDLGYAEKHIKVDDLPEPDLPDDFQEKLEATIKETLKELVPKPEEKKIPAVPIDTDEKKTGGFKSLGDFCKATMQGIKNQQIHNWVQKTTGMGEAINADGGFLIPEEYSMAILNAISEAGVLAPKCLNFPVNNNLNLPFVNRTTQATSWTGGVTIYKPAEGVAKTASQPPLGKCELKLHKMTALVYATDELLNDSPIALETFLTTLVSTEMALTKDEDIINGSGAGEALGVMNAPCLVSVTKETGQPATTIVYENVAKMWSRLYSPSRAGSVWLINQDCMEQISKLSIAVGTGGSGVFVVNAATAIPQTIFGAPIIWSPHCQTLGTTGDIILANFSQYVSITKAGMGMETATSIHVKFVEDETAFRFVVRFDGQPWWSSAVTPKHGTNTVSPFVALATRS